MVYKNKNVLVKKPFVRRAKVVPKSKANMVALIKKTVLKQNETKNIYSDLGKVELYHNAGSPASGRINHITVGFDSSVNMPSQGVSDIQRIGDSIILRGIKVRLMLGHKKDRTNVQFKIVVIRCEASNYPNTIAQMWDNQTGNIMLDSLNTDRFKVVYNKNIKSFGDQYVFSDTAILREKTLFHKFYIPLNKTIKFTADGGKDYNGPKHYLFVYAYDAYGTLITDNIAYFQAYSNLYYKDP